MVFDKNRLLSSVALIIVLSAWASSGLSVCEYHKCTPDCVCDIRYDDTCAIDYGNYGWIVPVGTAEYVFNHMRPNVSD